MAGRATERINEHYEDLAKELTGEDWSTTTGSLSIEILAIKRYLDELAERGAQRR